MSIILDVSHSSETVVVSHTAFRGHCDTARNIAGSLMQQITANEELNTVGYWDNTVCGNSPKDLVAAMPYGLELVGEDHLSLGSGYDGSITTGFDTSELVALTDEML